MKIALQALAITLLLSCYHPVFAQIDSTLLNSPAKVDTAKHNLNMDAAYNRPFLKLGKTPVSIGGYFESDYLYTNTSGITNGSQFQFRRFSLFVASTISKHIKFLSEIEYENDPTGDPGESAGPQFGIEYAALDIEFSPMLTLRGGLILNPIGAFNQNHDGPKYEFTDRPIAMTQLLPDTWSNTGFGLYGKQYNNHWMFGYEFYVTGGFDDAIIDNTQGKTFLPAANASTSRLTSSASGEPLYTGKLSFGNDQVGELGLSYMGGVYNTWRVEGAQVDDKRSVNVFDVDFNTTIPKLHTAITAEYAWIFVDLPPDYTPEYAHKQNGGYVDVVQPIIHGKILDWDNATVNIAVRGEYVDYNQGNFAATGTRMYNNLWSVMPAISFRPTPQTVLRLNYRIEHSRDITGNSIGAAIGPTRGISFGISSYF
jgi:Phosphate-selective porin O and P